MVQGNLANVVDRILAHLSWPCKRISSEYTLALGRDASRREVQEVGEALTDSLRVPSLAPRLSCAILWMGSREASYSSICARGDTMLRRRLVFSTHQSALMILLLPSGGSVRDLARQ